MLGQSTMLFQRGQMHLGRVTLVAVETILGVLLVKLLHFTVASHLGQNGGRRNRRYPTVTLHHRLCRTDKLGDAVTVHQHAVHVKGQSLYRTLHGQQGRVEDVQLIDFFRFSAPQRPGQSMRLDLNFKLQPFLFTDFL